MIRADEHAQLSLYDFIRFFKEGWAFGLRSEVFARKMIVPLRGVMTSQVRAWLTYDDIIPHIGGSLTGQGLSTQFSQRSPECFCHLGGK